MKLFAILKISKLWSCLRGNNCKPCLFWSTNIWSFAYVSKENFLTTPPRRQHFRKTFLLFGQNFRKSWSKHDNPPPPPPNVDVFTTSLSKRRYHGPNLAVILFINICQLVKYLICGQEKKIVESPCTTKISKSFRRWKNAVSSSKKISLFSSQNQTLRLQVRLR
jgi:hypothetical protein